MLGHSSSGGSRGCPSSSVSTPTYGFLTVRAFVSPDVPSAPAKPFVPRTRIQDSVEVPTIQILPMLSQAVDEVALSPIRIGFEE